MKKLILPISLLLILPSPLLSMPLNYGIGWQGWLAGWSPAQASLMKNEKFETLFLHGPSAYISIPEGWSLSGMVLQNRLLTWNSGSYDISGKGSAGDYTITVEDAQMERLDGDITVSRMISENFLLSAAYKYTSSSIKAKDGNSTIISQQYTLGPVTGWDETGHGMEMGLSSTLPFNDYISLSLTGSFVAMRSTFTLFSPYENALEIGSRGKEYVCWKVGGYLATMAGLYIPDAHLSLNAGIRLQYLGTVETGNCPDLSSESIYGLVLGVSVHI